MGTNAQSATVALIVYRRKVPHPNNRYCEDESGCDWKAWGGEPGADNLVKVFQPFPQNEADAVSPFLPPMIRQET